MSIIVQLYSFALLEAKIASYKIFLCDVTRCVNGIICVMLSSLSVVYVFLGLNECHRYEAIISNRSQFFVVARVFIRVTFLASRFYSARWSSSP